MRDLNRPSIWQQCLVGLQKGDMDIRRERKAVIERRDECTAELKLPTEDSLSEIPRNTVYFCTEDLIEITSKPMLRKQY